VDGVDGVVFIDKIDKNVSRPGASFEGFARGRS
jgi:hypothetical protein